MFIKAGYASHISFLMPLINIPIAYSLEGKIKSVCSEPADKYFDFPASQVDSERQNEGNIDIFSVLAAVLTLATTTVIWSLLPMRNAFQNMNLDSAFVTWNLSLEKATQ